MGSVGGLVAKDLAEAHEGARWPPAKTNVVAVNPNRAGPDRDWVLSCAQQTLPWPSPTARRSNPSRHLSPLGPPKAGPAPAPPMLPAGRPREGPTLPSRPWLIASVGLAFATPWPARCRALARRPWPNLGSAPPGLTVVNLPSLDNRRILGWAPSDQRSHVISP